jgi:hypothetical protein
MLTPNAVAHFLRHLYVPLALRRCPVARLISQEMRARDPDMALHAEDIAFVRIMATECLEAIESEPRTMRGSTQRSRHSAILLRYEIKGEPRETVAADLGISRRQFYRERERALQVFTTLLSDRIIAGRLENSSFGSGSPFIASPLAAEQL